MTLLNYRKVYREQKPQKGPIHIHISRRATVFPVNLVAKGERTKKKRFETPSVVEDHERWVQGKWKQNVGNNRYTHRHGRGEAVDLPTVRSKTTQVDHGAYHGDHHHEHPFETCEDLRHLHEEVRVLLLFSGRTPIHVNREHVCADCHGDVERKATEEYNEERHPPEIL